MANAAGLFRSLDDLEPMLDADGAVWFPLAQVCALLRQMNTRYVTREIVYGQRRRRTECGRDWKMQKAVCDINDTALVEVCRALGSMPNHEVRAYVGRARNRAKQSKGAGMIGLGL